MVFKLLIQWEIIVAIALNQIGKEKKSTFDTRNSNLAVYDILHDCCDLGYGPSILFCRVPDDRGHSRTIPSGAANSAFLKPTRSKVGSSMTGLVQKNNLMGGLMLLLA
ncbi:hypothetical protein [Bradyrhizobium sp. CCGUVB14]|uniref:hypothetical protein n=1 Tax=Bradyrhizobium sp. CCGUVB14 TaxID=2949628 RepID=UPI0020B40EF6|nr:hypothetical protein [Bradyrhizobium sp. CCGUVB14]MCP3439788.1 hypothetical protein [Bradyrhizobium sp. CCGUVB14]